MMQSARILFRAAIFGEIDLTCIEAIENNPKERMDSSMNIADDQMDVKPSYSGDFAAQPKLPKFAALQEDQKPLELEAFDSIIGLATVKEALMNMLVRVRGWDET
jgi:hypothetical protein